MTGKKIESLRIVSLRQSASRDEEAAETARKNNAHEEKIGALYLEAARKRRDVGDYAYAEDDLIKAERFAFPYDEDKKKYIKQQIEEIHSMKAAKNLSRKIDEHPKSKYLTTFAVLSIASLLVALGFVSLSLTGNVVGGLDTINSRWVGLCFFICGLVFSFIYLRAKKR
jgi:hypothetical protein